MNYKQIADDYFSQYCELIPFENEEKQKELIHFGLFVLTAESARLNVAVFAIIFLTQSAVNNIYLRSHFMFIAASQLLR